MTDKKEIAQKVMKKFLWEPRFSKGDEKYALVQTLKEVINQLQYNQTCWDEPLQHMVLDVDDILELCEELEKL